MRKTNLLCAAIIAISFFVGFSMYSGFPEDMVSHWNVEGMPDSYVSKAIGLFLIPAILLLIFLLFLLIPVIDPDKKNFEHFRGYYDWFTVVVMLFLFYVYILTVYWNVGFKFSMLQMIIPALALVVYYLGIMLEKTRKNWFVGIRTPWTLSSDKVWKKTHKMAGKAFRLVSIVFLFGLLFKKYAIWFVLIPIFVVVIYTVWFSYAEYESGRK
jgi:uncharacterized membrane protein